MEKVLLKKKREAKRIMNFDNKKCRYFYVIRPLLAAKWLLVSANTAIPPFTISELIQGIEQNIEKNKQNNTSADTQTSFEILKYDKNDKSNNEEYLQNVNRFEFLLVLIAKLKKENKVVDCELPKQSIENLLSLKKHSPQLLKEQREKIVELDKWIEIELKNFHAIANIIPFGKEPPTTAFNGLYNLMFRNFWN